MKDGAPPLFFTLQICKSVIGAAEQVVIPCEATVKGYGSLVRTLDAVKELQEIGASDAQILGVIPFRDRWVGANQTQESRMCIGPACAFEQKVTVSLESLSL